MGKKWWTDQIGDHKRSYRKDYKFISDVYSVYENRKGKNSNSFTQDD